jgi:hypothetical protein
MTLLLIVVMIAAVPPIEGSSGGKHNQASNGCSCHTNNGGMTATHNFPSTYNAGQIYTVNIGVNGGTQAFTGGFNVLVDKGMLMSPGNGVQITSSPSQSATHSSAGQLSWTFDWMAPVGGSGAVTVQVAVLQADGSQTNSGDAWNRVQTSITEAAPPNDPPSVSSVAVSPSPDANTNEALSLTYQFTDNDGDSESGSTVHWYVDGTHNTAHDGKTTIQSSLTTVGQKWKAEVTPSDGTDFGSSVMSNEITISTSTPTAMACLTGRMPFLTTQAKPPIQTVMVSATTAMLFPTILLKAPTVTTMA